MKIYPSDFNYNVKLIMTFSLFETSIRGIWGDNILTLFTYLITNNSNFLVGLLTGIVGFTQVIFTLFTAIFADKYPRKLSLQIGGIVSLIGIITSSIAVGMEHYLFLLISMIIWGLYWAFTSPALDALLADSVEMGNRSRVYSWSYTMRNIGNSVGPIVSLIMFATLGNNWKINECKIVILIGLFLSFIPTALLFLFQNPQNHNNSGEDKDIKNKDNFETSDFDSQSSHGMLSNFSSHGTEIDLDVEEGGEEEGKMNDNDNNQHNNQTVEISLIDEESEVDNKNTKTTSTTSKYFLCFPDIPCVPAMIALADVISGLASGMSIKFFPIYFADNMKMTPIDMSLLYMVIYLIHTFISLLFLYLLFTSFSCELNV